MDPRFISMFSIYNVVFPADETLDYIYTSILIGHLQIFSEEVRDIAITLVQITLQLYKVFLDFFLKFKIRTNSILFQIVLAELLPTPNRFHYIFNMRDLSRIMAGLLQSHPDYLPTVKQIVRLWRNEFIRIICDRLINENASIEKVNGKIYIFIYNLLITGYENCNRSYTKKDRRILGRGS